MRSNVTGTVAAISDYKENDYFNIALDDADVDENWYIGDGSLQDFDAGVEKGDSVMLKFDNGGVSEIDVIGGGEGTSEGQVTGDSRGSDAGKDNDDEGDVRGSSDFSTAKSSSTADNFLPKSKRIMLQVAFKKAVDQVDADAVEEQGRHLEQVSELTNGYFNLLSAQVKDKSGGEQ